MSDEMLPMGMSLSPAEPLRFILQLRVARNPGEVPELHSELRKVFWKSAAFLEVAAVTSGDSIQPGQLSSLGPRHQMVQTQTLLILFKVFKAVLYYNITNKALYFRCDFIPDSKNYLCSRHSFWTLQESDLVENDSSLGR